MKFFLNLSVVFFLLTTTTSFSQKKTNFNSLHISGKIVDLESNQPLEYATIVLKNISTEQITGGVSTKNGTFKIKAKKGTYDITIEFLGFKPKHFNKRKISAKTNLGTIVLTEDTNSLDEVEIIAEKSTVEIRLDKKIYNVGKDMTVKGGSVADVLDNVPSVTVDDDGTVALRGNTNVKILIDGKPSGLVGLSSTDALKQLPAEAIKKIEVITSPSARYEAEGTGGILNIILRKSKIQGFNGSITTSAGTPENYGLSANLNYRTKKFNFFTNSGLSYRTPPGNAFTKTNFLDVTNPNEEKFSFEERTMNRLSRSFNTNVGTEYYITDKASLTAAIFYRTSNSDDVTTNLNTFFDINNTLQRKATRTQDEDEKDNNISYSLNFTQNFKKSNQKLTFDLQYENSKEDGFSVIKDQEFFPNDSLEVEQNTVKEKQDRYLIQTDYIHPLGEDAQFEVGYRGAFRTFDNNLLIEKDTLGVGNYYFDIDTSNRLIFKENVNAGYVQYGSKINEKFSYLLGLRTEHTAIEIDLKSNNQVINKEYTNLFPTVNLGYEINEKENITLGYNRRLRRPRSWFMNPFISRSSDVNIFKGNPNLDPMYSNSFDLDYLKKWDKITLNSSIYFQKNEQPFEFISFSNGDLNSDNVLITYRTPINLDYNNRYGFEFTANYTPLKKWRLNANFNIYKSSTRGVYENVFEDDSNNLITETIIFDNDNYRWFTRLSSTTTLPYKISWQTRLSYRGPSETAQSKRKGIFSTNMSLSKDILKDKGTLVLNVSDLFNSRKRKSDTNTNLIDSYSEFQWRERQVRLTFTYRINQNKKRERQQRDNNGDNDGGF